MAQNSGNSIVRVANLKEFVDWLGVSEFELQMLYFTVELALHLIERNANSEEGRGYFTPSEVGRVKDIDVNQFLLSGNEKILAVYVEDGFSGDGFRFYNKENTNECLCGDFIEPYSYLEEFKL